MNILNLQENSKGKTLAKLLNRFTVYDEVEKYVEIMQWNCSNNYIYRRNVEILNIFDPELQLINTKPMIKNKLKELLRQLKMFKVQIILVLDYKKRNTNLPFKC